MPGLSSYDFWKLKCYLQRRLTMHLASGHRRGGSGAGGQVDVGDGLRPDYVLHCAGQTVLDQLGQRGDEGLRKRLREIGRCLQQLV